MQIMTVGSCGAWYVRPLTVTAGIRALSILECLCLISVPVPCRYGCSHNNSPLCPLGLALHTHHPLRFCFVWIGLTPSHLCMKMCDGTVRPPLGAEAQPRG